MLSDPWVEHTCSCISSHWPRRFGTLREAAAVPGRLHLVFYKYFISILWVDCWCLFPSYATEQVSQDVRDAYFQLNNYVETPCLLSPTINKTSCFLYQVNLQLPNQERQTHLATKSKTQPWRTSPKSSATPRKASCTWKWWSFLKRSLCWSGSWGL